jgi:hypothetical protein
MKKKSAVLEGKALNLLMTHDFPILLYQQPAGGGWRDPYERAERAFEKEVERCVDLLHDEGFVVIVPSGQECRSGGRRLIRDVAAVASLTEKGEAKRRELLSTVEK